MKKWTRLLALVLAVVLCVGTLAGCGNNSADTGKEPAKTDANNGANDAQEPAELVNDDSIKEFTIAYAIAPNDGPDIPDMWMWKEYEKKTGIHINWMYVEPASVGDQKNLLMMSDDRPDAWYGSWWTTEEMVKLGSDDMLVDLAPYLEKYAPNYVAELNKIDGGYASTVMPDGAIYSTAMIMNDPPQITDRIWLNSDWMSNLGLKTPTTMDELNAVLEAFKTEDANGNGDPNDEYPIYMPSGRYSQLEAMMCGWYGVGDGGIQPIAQWYYLDENNTPQFLWTSEGIKKVWQQSNEWWNNGYFHPDTFGTYEYETWVNAGIEDKIGMYEWVNAAILKPDAYKHFTPVSVVKADDQHDPVMSWWDFPVRDKNFTISSSCKAPGTLLSWIDGFYSDEGVEFSCYGIEGETFTRNEDGKPVYIDEIVNYPRGPQVGAWQYGFLVYGSFPQRAPLCIDNEIARRQDTNEFERLSDFYPDCEKYAPPKLMPALLATKEEGEELGNMYNDMGLLLNEARVKFITGEWNFEEDWDAYVQSLEDLGVARMMEIKGAQYDRYAASK